jgi:transcriptional regulator with XRE-family HTH domain
VVALKEGIGPAIKALRERRSLTQIDLAQRCNLSRGAIGQFERGLATPSLETLGRILEALDVDLSDLQRELDGKSGPALQRSGEVIEIGGVPLGPDEVERRLEEAFDRLVHRSLESGRKAAAPPPKVGVRVE